MRASNKHIHAPGDAVQMVGAIKVRTRSIGVIRLERNGVRCCALVVYVAILMPDVSERRASGL